MDKRVNALHRAPSISTGAETLVLIFVISVSMPYIGLHPFLQVDTPLVWKSIRCVNALHRAPSISTSLLI